MRTVRRAAVSARKQQYHPPSIAQSVFVILTNKIARTPADVVVGHRTNYVYFLLKIATSALKRPRNVTADGMTVRAVAHRTNDDRESVVSSVECIVAAYYSRTSDVPGAVQTTVRLPVSLAYDVHPSPLSDFSWSSKILVDESPVPIRTLFKGTIINMRIRDVDNERKPVLLLNY